MSTHFLPVFGLLILFVKITQKKYPPKQKYLIFVFILPSRYVNIMLKVSKEQLKKRPDVRGRGSGKTRKSCGLGFYKLRRH